MCRSDINIDKPGYKTCFKCKRYLPLSDFYRHRQMKDGHLGKCKACAKKDVSENYKSNREHYAEYEHDRFNSPERRASCLVYQKKLRAKSPDKYFARNAVNNALRDGIIIRGVCAECGVSENVEAHHGDYSRPLDIEWLCRKHHLIRHNKTAY